MSLKMTTEGTRSLRMNMKSARWPARVRVVGSDARAARLGAGPIVVGASSASDLVVDDASVSRRHVEIDVVPGGISVQDLGSRNGTFYLDQRIERAVLVTGSLIRIGTTTLALEIDPKRAEGDVAPRAAGFRGMVGGSDAMQRLYAFIARLDKSLAPVLVRGETGSGKELVARAIHEGSRVGSGPFVPINCGALPRELVASTLFGHKRGAFTGAHDARRGAFGAADGGTLLLDEIGELPLDLQPALLRALETGEITAVGEDLPRHVSVRILAATHRDLAADVRAGRFREDLYYRLAAVTLEIPALRERREDIPVLAELFARQEGWPSLPEEVLEELDAHSFPGNVRELRGLVVAHVTLGAFGPPRSSVRGSAGANPSVAVAPHLDAPFLEQRDALVERFTTLYLQKLLASAHGNQSVAAKMAGLDRTYLGRLIAKESRK